VTACCQVLELEDARRARGVSQRALATECAVPRTTWQSRARAAAEDGLPRGWQPFLESAAGLAFLTRLLVVILVVFVLRGGCSVTQVAEFFRAMHLRKLVASSPTSLRRVQAAVLQQVVAFGAAQQAAGAAAMPHREVVAAVDENFHWDQMLLVAMDLVSGFLFCETPATQRDGATWAATLTAATAGLDVTLVALTCDAAKGLRCCADLLKVPVGADILHVQHPVCQALARPMARQVEQAHQALAAARAAVAAAQTARADWARQPHGPGRPPDWDARDRAAVTTVAGAEAAVAAVVADQTAIRAGIRALSDHQHPVDLTTGAVRDAAQVRAAQADAAEQLCEQAGAAGLGTRAIEALNKVFRRLDDLAHIVAWWHLLVTRRVATLALPAASAAWVATVLVPALYVRHAARLGRDAATRAARRAVAATLWQGVVASPYWMAWSGDARRRVLAVAQSCVECFPRSSSSVEGRNGQDALCLHQRHQISPTFRQARVVLHNYVLRRPDGSTAAERFFGTKPDDLIAFLCDRVTLPGRGRLRDPKHRPSVLALAG
jgi:hypothetical protein